MSDNTIRVVLVALLGLLLTGTVSSAQDQVPGKSNTEESPVASTAEDEDGLEHGKINTADASPVDPGHIEIETSYAFTQSRNLWDRNGATHDRGLAEEHAIGLSATVGVFNNFDVNVTGRYLWLRDKENDFDNDGYMGPEQGNNFGDVDISGRYRFYENKEQGVEIAYIGSFTLPTGTSSSQQEIGNSQQYWSFNQTLVATKDWGKWTANVDIGYALPFGDKREDARGTFKADLAAGYQILPWLQPEIELNYCHDFVAHADDSEVLAVTLGLVMPINKKLRINTGVQQGVWGRNADKATSVIAAVKLAF